MNTAYRNNVKESIFLFLLGLFSPLLATPLILWSIYKKNLLSIYVLALLAALLIGLMPPYADNYHYYLIYKSAYTFDIHRWLITDKDFLFTLLSYIFNSFGLSYIQMRLFLIISEMFVFAWIFYDFTKEHISYLDNRKCLWFVLICFFVLDIVFICFFIRYALMATLLILSIYLFYKRQSFKACIILLASLSAHFSGLLFVPCILLAGLFRHNFPRSQRMISMLICLGLGMSVFSFLYAFVPSILQADTYVTGAWSGFSAKSFNGMMFYILQYYVIAGILALWYLCAKTNNSYLSKIAFFMLLLFGSVCTFSELSQRVWWIAKIFVVFALLETILVYSTNRAGLLKLYLLCALLLFSQVMSLYGFREAIFDHSNLKHAVNLSSFIWEEPYDDAYFFHRSIQ